MSEVENQRPAIYGRSLLLTPLFFVFRLPFECVVRARNRMYDASMLPQVRLPHPVISIGNLTAGGSGKTPLVIHVAQTLSRLGVTPVLLSRGYGRAERAAVILPPGEDLLRAVEVLGDEPALVRHHEPRLWLGISPNRHAAGLRILQQVSRPIFILDDGFQHRRLRRDLDLVVIDRTQPLASNRMLPGGTLREPPSGLRRADIVVINGLHDARDQDPLEALVRSIKQDATIFHCVQRIDRLVSFADWRCKRSAAVPPGDATSAFLVAAIGNPDRFRRDVRALGIDVKGSRFFRDHTSLKRSDWLSCAREASALGAAKVITTEKDAVKLLPGELDIPLLVAVQSTGLAEQAEFESMLGAMIEGDR